MDRIELTQDDIFTLMEWRDQHKELVRSLPAPLKAVEITFKHNSYRIKGIRDGNRLTIMLHDGMKKLQDVKFEIQRGTLVKTGGFTKLTHDAFQDVLTTYCSLMALMVYGGRNTSEPDEESRTEPSPRTAQKRPQKRPAKRTTYIIRNDRGALNIAPRGSHASPKGIFTVRGHYRHYKSGKVVWIPEYKKGEGKKKKKTYRIGGNSDGHKAI